MRILSALALFAGLTACAASEEETPVEPVATDTPQTFLAADGKPPYGLFDVTAPDGQVYREVIRADGTFSSTARDGSAVTGTWKMREEGVFCSKPDGAPADYWRCKNEVVNEDGIWTSTEIDGGAVSTVVRVEAP